MDIAKKVIGYIFIAGFIIPVLALLVFLFIEHPIPTSIGIGLPTLGIIGALLLS